MRDQDPNVEFITWSQIRRREWGEVMEARIAWRIRRA